MENMLQLDLFDFDNEVMEIAPDRSRYGLNRERNSRSMRRFAYSVLKNPAGATIESDRPTNCFHMGRKVKSTATSRRSVPSKRWKKPEKPLATPIIRLC